MEALAQSHPKRDRTPKGEAGTSRKRVRRTTPRRKGSSTTNAFVPVPFWNTCSGEVSQKLWLPVGTDLPYSLETTSSSQDGGSCSRVEGNSWFSARQVVCPPPTHSEPPSGRSLLACSSPSTSASAAGTTERVLCKIDEWSRKQEQPGPPKPKRIKKSKKNPEGGWKDQPGKAMRLRVYPTTAQKKILMGMIGTVRWVYNEALRAVRNEGISPFGLKALRARLVNNEAIDRMEQERIEQAQARTAGLPAAAKDKAIKRANLDWLRSLPYDMRDEGIRDLKKAYESALAKRRKDGRTFRIKPRSRKRCTHESIVIHAKHYNGEKARQNKGTYGMFHALKTEKKRYARKLPETIAHDSRLVYERGTGHFYLCMPMALEVRDENQAPRTKRVIALDPGVKTFLTGYEPEDGHVSEAGMGDVGRIKRLQHHIDRLKARIRPKKKASSLLPTLDRQHKRALRKSIARIRVKVRNLVKDMHCRVAKLLCENYHGIILPVFSAKGRMVERGTRRASKQTVKDMLSLAHGAFRQRLLNKAREYPWCRIALVREDYTSVTCGRCGTINRRMMLRHRTFWCPHCHLRSPRDAHAGRNILIRFMSGIDRP